MHAQYQGLIKNWVSEACPEDMPFKLKLIPRRDTGHTKASVYRTSLQYKYNFLQHTLLRYPLLGADVSADVPRAHALSIISQ